MRTVWDDDGQQRLAQPLPPFATREHSRRSRTPDDQRNSQLAQPKQRRRRTAVNAAGAPQAMQQPRGRSRAPLPDATAQQGQHLQQLTQQEQGQGQEENQQEEEQASEQQQQQQEEEEEEQQEEEQEDDEQEDEEDQEQPRRVRARRARGPAPERWQTLKHNGVLFPSDYQPHGIKMRYDGQSLDLEPEAEEVVTSWVAVVMKQSAADVTAAMRANFLTDLNKMLDGAHVVASLDRCNFDAIRKHLEQLAKAKKELPDEAKAVAKAQRAVDEAKYMTAEWNGRAEPVGNFRVEPPGVFLGCEGNTNNGRIKARIRPKDITINISEGAPVPAHPYPGEQWKEVRHDKHVTWLARWRDPIYPKQYKYVYLAANSGPNRSRDMAKYDKARELAGMIEDIRSHYTSNFDAQDLMACQMAVAIYFIDKLALRAGHEKDGSQADTVGCCTLKVSNVTPVPPSSIRFLFQGKDSIEYDNTVEVEAKVYDLVQQFMDVDKNDVMKDGSSMLFDTFNADQLNRKLKDYLPGLSAKMFRTYNASILLERVLREKEEQHAANGQVIGGQLLKAMYIAANTQVAVLCNHQRNVPQRHMARLQNLMSEQEASTSHLQTLQDDLAATLAGQRELSSEWLKRLIKQEQDKLAINSMQMATCEAEKGVALSTSKINYMDPRITVAWAKRNSTQCDLVWDASLMSKFQWAMDTDAEFKFAAP